VPFRPFAVREVGGLRPMCRSAAAVGVKASFLQSFREQRAFQDGHCSTGSRRSCAVAAAPTYSRCVAVIG
jgi:hypothetical protein